MNFDSAVYLQTTPSWGNKKDEKYIGAQSRSLGYYKLMMDSIAPDIKPINISEGTDISHNKNIIIKINDKQTGIKLYRATFFFSTGLKSILHSASK